MNRRTGSVGTFGLCATLSVVSVLALSSFLFAEGEDRVLLDDARVTGHDIRVYDQDNGQQVMLVQGNFRLAAGRRSVMGQNAVLWIKDREVGGATIHEMVIYAEGHVTINEGDGTSMTDRTRVITMSQQGRLSVAKVKKGEEPLEESELFLRAQAEREKAEHPGLVPAAAPATKPATSQPTSRPTPAPINVDYETIAVYDLPALAKQLAVNGKLDETQKFLAQQAASYPNLVRAMVIVKPSITVGEPDRNQYMTMTAESAVVYTEKSVAPKDARTPVSMRMVTFGQGESISGAYLDNSVVITQGDKKLTATRVYYDFTRDRALLINPVYKTVLPTRNVPLYVRAEEARQVNAREMVFTDAQVSTSDFRTPSYAIASKELRVQDKTLYNDQGRPISYKALAAEANNVTYEVYGIPIFYWPKFKGELEENHSALKRASIGSFGNMGSGVETEWDLFRLLGLARPTGVEATLEADYYSHGPVLGIDAKWQHSDERRDYYGYALLYEVYDTKGTDSFGQDAEDIPAPTERGRILARHKEFLPDGWEVQFELSYMCDRNFLQEYFRNEFWAGKEQETLLYAKKQEDNWAFTSLLQYRLNRFLTQTDSYPDLSFYLIGQPLADGKLTFFSENHAGLKRWRPANYEEDVASSDVMARGDTRNELDAPMHWGPINVTPYTVGRVTGWSQAPGTGGIRPFGPPNAEGGINQFLDNPQSDGDTFRPYGQVGMRTNTHIWQMYDGVESRTWDLNGLKHIITPEALAWAGCTGVDPSDLFPMDPGIEQFMGPTGGAAVGVHQRLQTKRGEPGKMETVDWMRLSVFATFLNNVTDTNDQPSVGSYDFSRPEYSRAPNSYIADYAWNISDSTAFLSDININQNDMYVGQFDAGFAVQRDPRTRYYLGIRMIDDLNSSLGIFGVNYKLSKIYTLSFFEQYDFRFNNGQNLLSTVSIIRKFPRWYAGLSLALDKTQNNLGLYLTIWPEGVPEVSLGSSRLSPLGSSTKN